MRALLLALASLILGACASQGETVAEAAGPSDCLNGPARQFDFLLGEWVIEQRILQNDGSWAEFAADSTVSLAMGGCAVVEDWRGHAQFFWAGMKQPEHLRALSMRIWDPRKQRWVIHWMDSLNPQFGNFVGRFNDRYGLFFRATPAEEGETAVITRMAYADTETDAIKWELAMSNDGGQNWQPLWVQTMRRKQAQ